MKRVNALQLRQSLGKIMSALRRSGEPILLERGREPIGAIISLRDFHERFVERAAARERQQVLDEMDEIAIRSKDSTAVVDVLRELRGDA